MQALLFIGAAGFLAGGVIALRSSGQKALMVLCAVLSVVCALIAYLYIRS